MRPRQLQFVLAAPFALALLAALFWYVLRPAYVKAYYTRLFTHAQTITISPRTSPKPIALTPSKTLRRRDHPEFFTRLEAAVRNGFVRPYQTTDIPRWEMEVTDGRGRTTQVDVRYCLVSQSQPSLRALWFYPVLPDWGGDPGIFPLVDPLMDAKPSAPAPTTASAPRSARSTAGNRPSPR